jgi:hypothetical protein
VNSIQSSQQFGGKKKNNTTKGKGKKYSFDQEVTKTQGPAAVGLKQKKKEKYPCMICVEDNYTKDCPHKDEVTWFLKGNSQPTVLTYPFPPQQQQMIAQNPVPCKEDKQVMWMLLQTLMCL